MNVIKENKLIRGCLDKDEENKNNDETKENNKTDKLINK